MELVIYAEGMLAHKHKERIEAGAAPVVIVSKPTPNSYRSSGKVHSCGVAQAQVIDGVALVTARERRTAHALPRPQL